MQLTYRGKKREVPYGRGTSRVLDALSCYLSLIFKHSDTKLDLKNIVDQNFEGARTCCAPLDPPLQKWELMASLSHQGLAADGMLQSVSNG